MSSVKCVMSVATVGLALSYPVLSARPALAQIPSNPQVEIVYARPRAASLQAVANRLKSRRVLEEFAQFMLPLKLPTTLTVQFDQCGGNARLYKPGEPATICYELVDQIEKIAAKSADDDGEMMLAGAVTQAVFHAAANAVFDILDVPIWGRREDAADRLAGFLMVEVGSDLAYWTIVGTASFFQDSGKTWTGSQFADVRSPEAQRFYNYLCMALGGDRETFTPILRDTLLKTGRVVWCAKEYSDLRFAFNKTIMPHVDPDLLKTIQSMEWLKADDGRLAIKEVEGSRFEFKADLVLLAMGFLGPRKPGMVEQAGLALDPRGNVLANVKDYKTSVPKLFAAGDMRRGQSLVVWAIREGRQCARSIDESLMGSTTLPR